MSAWVGFIFRACLLFLMLAPMLMNGDLRAEESIIRVSLTQDGSETNDNNRYPRVSSNGRYVVFHSTASNLTSGDTNGIWDVYVRDVQTGTVSRVSVSSSGVEGNGNSLDPCISADGRYVAFQSYADNLVPGDTNGCEDVFVHDRQTGITQCASVAPDETIGNLKSHTASLSGDGRFVAFQSRATNLVAGGPEEWQIYVRDLQSGVTERVSKAADGTPGTGFSQVASISGDGRYVAFYSNAPNLITGDTNAATDVFVHDRQTGETTRVSVSSGGAQATSGSYDPSVSYDGRYVAFASTALTLVSGDNNGAEDVFVHDRQTGETTRVSVSSTGAQGNGGSRFPGISGDGTRVVFQSNASNLVDNDTNGTTDIFLHDRSTGRTTRLSAASDGTQGNGLSESPEISVDGSCAVFHSAASNLVVGDTNGATDIFLAREQVVAPSFSPGAGTYTGSVSVSVSCATSGATIRYTTNGADPTASSTVYAAPLVFNVTTTLKARAFKSGMGDSTIASAVYTVTAPLQVAAPTFSPGAGTYSDSVTVSLSCATSGATIRYTMDGSEPTSSSAVYSSPLTLTSATTVKAKAFKDGMTDSEVASATYAVSAPSQVAAPSFSPPGGTYSGSVSVSFSCSTSGAVIRYTTDGSEPTSSSTAYTASVTLTTTTTVKAKAFKSDMTDSDTASATYSISSSGSNNTIRVSVASDGTEGNEHSRHPAVSSDGRFTAFESSASNLTAGDSNGVSDVFVHDRQTGETTRVSVATGGAQGNYVSECPSISSDGRYVAFVSFATNFASDDTNGIGDVFVHDRLTGETIRVSEASDGTPGNGTSDFANISLDGRYVAFISMSSNLVSGDTNGVADVFVHDRQMGTTTRVSVSSSGTQGNGWIYGWPTLSSDGRYVAFASLSSNLVAGDTNGVADVFVHDRQTGTTTRVSVSSSGIQGNDSSGSAFLSPGGRYVAFRSTASNLVDGDSNGIMDVFVHDLETGTTSRLGTITDGAEEYSFVSSLCLSTDGRYVAYDFCSYSESAGLILSDLFVYDRQTGSTNLVSTTVDGDDANGSSNFPAFSPDGRYVAFRSDASNLVPGDANNTSDVFVKEWEASDSKAAAPVFSPAGGAYTDSASVTISSATSGAIIRYTTDGTLPTSASTIYTTPLTFTETTTLMAFASKTGMTDSSIASAVYTITVMEQVATPEFSPSGGTYSGSVSVTLSCATEGAVIRYTTDGSEPTSSSTTYTAPVTLTTTTTVKAKAFKSGMTDSATASATYSFGSSGSTDDLIRVSTASDGTEGNMWTWSASLSAEGRYAAFHSDSSNLVDGDTNDCIDTFVKDLQTGQTTRVSVASDGSQASCAVGSGMLNTPSISGDGRYVAFMSPSPDLVDGDDNGLEDIFVHDRDTGETTRVSVSTSGLEGDGRSYDPHISADGRYVAFVSESVNFAPDATWGPYVYCHDRQTSETGLVSVTPNGEPMSMGEVQGPSISADGRYVAFTGRDHITDADNIEKVFLYDRQTGGVTPVADVFRWDTPTCLGATSLSSDGRYVAFVSFEDDLVSGDDNVAADIFVNDRQTDVTTRVSVASDGTGGNMTCYDPSISGDGRYVTFSSSASNLVSGDTNDCPDVFVHDRQTRRTVRVSVSGDGAEANAESYMPFMSSDGRYVAFGSQGSNLVPDDENGTSDAFARRWKKQNGPEPQDGIWKSEDGAVNLYVQKYESGACVLVAAAGAGNYTAFLDSDCSDGIDVPDDLVGGGYTIELTTMDSQNGQVYATLPLVGMISREVSLAFAARTVSDTPLNGIWKSTDDALSLYLQKYETGSCILVATLGDGTYTIFLDPAYEDGIQVDNDLDGGGHGLTLTTTSPSSGTVTVDLPGYGTLTKAVALRFQDVM